MAHTTISRQVEPRQASHTGRHDIYAGVHKGLRSFMTETLVAAGRVDVHDPAELIGTLAQVRSLLDACRAHLHAENQFLHPAMEARRPGSARETAKDHEDHVRALETLETDVLALERAQPGVRGEAARRLYDRLAGFVAENFVHMHDEETGNNAVLWATYADEELAEIQQAIVASLPPEKMALFLRWMVPAMSPAERAGLLAGIQLGAPREVFDRVLATARPHLTEREWTKLMAALAPLPVSQ
jgi:iron-sulfur cluster repair protein YtfE (RIC family)